MGYILWWKRRRKSRLEEVPSLNILLRRFGGRIAVTLSLIVLEAVGWVLFPLVIGRAIDGVLAGSQHGLFELAVLGFVAMGIAITRQIVDSRAYARIYARLGEELIGSHSESTTSTKTARLGMLRETVEFFENSVPALVRSLIELGGPILILSALSRPVFYGCLAVLGVTVVVYALTGRMTTRYNRELNDEHERQVDAVESGDASRIGRHLREMMRWNIKLSDLEAGTFGVVWLFLIGLLVYSIAVTAENTVAYGAVFAIVMYVFQFTESVTSLPLYYQQWLRLREISGRLVALVAKP